MNIIGPKINNQVSLQRENQERILYEFVFACVLVEFRKSVSTK